MFRFDFIRRLICFALGTMLLGFGVAISTCAGLGTSPISSVPYVLTCIVPLSFGTCTFLFNFLFVALQIIILRRDYRKAQLLQLGAVFVLGVFIDLGMLLVESFVPPNYPMQCLELLAGCFLIAFGVSLQLLADISYVPGDGLIQAICTKFGVEFGVTKLTFDSSLVVFAAVLSFLCLIELVGLREGTLLAAVGIGPTIRLLLPRLRFIKKLLLVRAVS